MERPLNATAPYFDFTAEVISDIRLLFANTTARLLINGRLSEAFEMSTGIRQGDSLSCALYVIAVSAILKFAASCGISGYIAPVPRVVGASPPQHRPGRGPNG